MLKSTCIETHGEPRWDFIPFGLKSCFTVVVPGCPWNLETKLIEPPRQTKTTFLIDSKTVRKNN